uniref:4-Cys prefix domain-containing protein n=1 Tax=Desertifilum tharense IPPAS B-1220 TaxID=1781255 RepID=A0ACD5GRT1_9CYAN
MSYCFNLACSKPHNPESAQFCQSCGSKLLLGDRYRAIEALGVGVWQNPQSHRRTYPLKTAVRYQTILLWGNLFPEFAPYPKSLRIVSPRSPKIR